MASTTRRRHDTLVVSSGLSLTSVGRREAELAYSSEPSLEGDRAKPHLLPTFENMYLKEKVGFYCFEIKKVISNI